jgi:hypothetical protein
MPTIRALRHAGLAVVPALALVLGGCSSDSSDSPAGGPVSSPSVSGVTPPAASDVYDENLSHHPTTYGTVGPGYPDPSDPPPPAGTFSPSPGAWADVQPPESFRVTVVAAAKDPQAAVVVDAVRSWAADESVDLDVVMVERPGDNLADLSAAIRAEPDLIVSAGDTLIDAMALVTASAPERRFLILGGEIPEPTANVTAVDWLGAGFRGEGLGRPTTYDPASFTSERSGRAIRAGVAAVLTNWSGFVVWLS